MGRKSRNQSTARESTMLQYTRQLLAGVVVFIAGTHVNRLDQSLTRVTNLRGVEGNFGASMNENAVVVSDSRSNFQLAFDQSLGFFDDLPEEDWKIHQGWARRQGSHRYVAQPNRQYGKPALWYYNNYNPIFNCPHAKRVSGIGDGPKWMCDPHRLVRQAERRKAAGLPGPHCLIYSVGSNGNYEFEDGMYLLLSLMLAFTRYCNACDIHALACSTIVLNFGILHTCKGLNRLVGNVCETHIFDYSNNYNREENADKNMHFHQIGLQGTQQDRHARTGEFLSFPDILKRLGHENRTIDIFKIDCEGCEWDTYKVSGKIC